MRERRGRRLKGSCTHSLGSGGNFASSVQTHSLEWPKEGKRGTDGHRRRTVPPRYIQAATWLRIELSMRVGKASICQTLHWIIDKFCLDLRVGSAHRQSMRDGPSSKLVQEGDEFSTFSSPFPFPPSFLPSLLGGRSEAVQSPERRLITPPQLQASLALCILKFRNYNFVCQVQSGWALPSS